MQAYSLDDFKKYDSVYALYRKTHDGVNYHVIKDDKGYSVDSTEISRTSFQSLLQAKQWLFVNYQVPMSGWKAYSNCWTSTDKKWTLRRSDDRPLWIIRKRVKDPLDKSFHTLVGLRFKTRESAIEWINGFEKAHGYV